MSSKEGQQDPTTSNHSYDSIGNELNTEDKDNQEDCSKKNLAYQQDNDLLGLALQTSATNLPGNEMNTSNATLEAMSQGHIYTCLIHTSILSNAALLPSQSEELKQLPMNRYLAEDLSQRYALVNISRSGSGEQWARYPGCLCGQQLLVLNSNEW